MFRTVFLQSLAVFLMFALSFSSAAQSFDGPGKSLQVDFGGASATSDARIAAQWVAANADNQRLPFVIIDKKNARAFVFDADRQLKGATAVLLGLAVGDEGLVDMSDREISSLIPHEKTTPAGRFLGEPGRNLQGEKIVWFDYAAKLAIHRLRPDFQRERRAQRLATATVEDNRISLGCIVVPVAFYESVIGPVLGNSRSVIYVLPETRSLQAMLDALQTGTQ